VAGGSTVFAQGEEHPFVYVIRSGMTKNEYLCENGHVRIKSFSREGDFFASMSALRRGGLTSFSAVAIESCELDQLPFAQIEAFAQSELRWAHMLLHAFAWVAQRNEHRERDLLMNSPEDRYLAFTRTAPDIERRVTQKDLAAYLGMTPVGLNRIVQRVRAGR
jgi:CRP-like cAMP-binding protein